MELQDFYDSNIDLNPPIKPPLTKAHDIQNHSGLPWLVMKGLSIPYKEMLEEAKSLKRCFVPHRNGGGHTGWRSLCIHGLSSVHTESPETYGLNPDSVTYSWTDICRFCPATQQFLLKFGYLHYARVRFMLLEPGGYVLPHSDALVDRLGAINIALNQPIGCEFLMEGCGKVPFEDGSAIMLSLSRHHMVWNRSDEDRYHIIVHGARNPIFWNKIIEESYQ